MVHNVLQQEQPIFWEAHTVERQMDTVQSMQQQSVLK